MRLRRPALLFAAGILVFASHVAFAAEDAADRSWGYRGEPGKIAPADWPDVCQTGSEQSPIDIARGSRSPLPADPVVVSYAARDSLLRDGGHDVQVAELAGGVQVASRPFLLCEIHFHTPSEHTVDNVGAAAEAHFVHKSGNCLPATPAAVVIGARIELASPTHPPTQRLEDYLAKLGQGLPVRTGALDPTPILASVTGYYQYAGSLTSPGCAQGVTWLVTHQPLFLSAATLDLLRQRYPNNARPGQALRGRRVRGFPGR